MQLNVDQQAQVSQRLAAGASVADIQRLVNDEFGIPMTYMEIRFLIDDLNLEVVGPPKPTDPAAEAEKSAAAKPAEEAEAVLEDDEFDSPVRVEIDKVKRPGAALSGSVVFSDGKKAQWFVDTYGRLGLDPDEPGYQPSETDIQEFQMELQRKMQGPI